MRGLKLGDLIKCCFHNVAPYVGAWIETSGILAIHKSPVVAPYVGAWIETFWRLHAGTGGVSHPTWVRGLKLPLLARGVYPSCVAPYVGAWIETFWRLHAGTGGVCRTLRGCVD